MMKIQNLETDLSDGVILHALFASLTPKHIRINKNPKTRLQKLENIHILLQFLHEDGIKFVGIGASGNSYLFY